MSSDDRSPWQPTAPPHHPVHLPHGCSSSLRAELHPGRMGRGRRKGGRRWRHPEFRWDKCGGTETGLETRERTVTPAQNLCLMIIAYPRIRVSEGSPMEFSLPRAFIKNIKASSNPGISLALGALDAYARKSPLGRSELFVVACARVRVTSLLATRITVLFVSEDHFVVRSHMKKKKKMKRKKEKREKKETFSSFIICVRQNAHT